MAYFSKIGYLSLLMKRVSKQLSERRRAERGGVAILLVFLLLVGYCRFAPHFRSRGSLATYRFIAIVLILSLSKLCVPMPQAFTSCSAMAFIPELFNSLM